MGLVLKNALFDQLGPQPPEEVPPELLQAPVAAQAFQNPYTSKLAAVRQRLLDLDAQQNQPMYSPDELAARNQGSKRDEAYGMLAALSGDPGLSEVGGQLLKTALAGRQRKQTEHGEYDPATGAFKYFPEYQRQQQRTALTGEAGRLEAAEAAAQTQQLARQETLADRQEGRRSQQSFQEGQNQMNRDLRRDLGEASRSARQEAQGSQQAQRNAQLENTAHDDYVKQVKDDLTVVNAHRNLKELAKRPDAAGDIAFIFQYMKMLDPNSVVREGEFATAQNAAGVPSRIQNLYNNVLHGTRLGPGQRQEMLGAAGSIAGNSNERINQAQTWYSEQAKRRGLDPANIYSPLMPEGPQPQVHGQPAPGAASAPLNANRRGAQDRRGQQKPIMVDF